MSGFQPSLIKAELVLRGFSVGIDSQGNPFLATIGPILTRRVF
jgi:hypothetical protein